MYLHNNVKVKILLISKKKRFIIREKPYQLLKLHALTLTDAILNNADEKTKAAEDRVRLLYCTYWWLSEI